MNILENVNLKNMNTFKLDVTAKYFFEINSTEDIFFIFNYIKEKKEEIKIEKDFKYFILGDGSNVLFLNNFYDGLIIKSNFKDINILNNYEDKLFIKVGSGYEWDSFVQYCCENNYCGTENLSHIPGTVGAAPVQNIGAYGVEVSELIYEVECYDIKNKKFLTLKNTENQKECDFSYRDSIFKRKNYFIISVTFVLSKEKRLNLNYKDVQDYISGGSEAAAKEKTEKDLTLLEIREMIINIRNSKMPNWRDEKSVGTAGSFFKNIIVEEDIYEKLKKDYVDLPIFKTEKEGKGVEVNNVLDENKTKYKLSSAYIIDKILKMRNFRVGYVGTYKNQALIIVNYGKASGQDIYNFSENIIKKVKNLLDLNLEREVNVID